LYQELQRTCTKHLDHAIFSSPSRMNNCNATRVCGFRLTNLETQLKESPAALRDLQTVTWIRPRSGLGHKLTALTQRA